MSASKSTYLHSFSAFPCNFPLSKGHFPDHMGPIWGQKPDTYCRIFKKLFSSWAKKKTGMLSCTPVICRIYAALSGLCRPQCGPNCLYWLCPCRLGLKVSLISLSPEQRRIPLFLENILASFYRDLFRLYQKLTV